MAVASWAEEEGGAQRLENAQKGMAEASWPRKPDNRLSPLSGKMKEISEISPRYYGQEKEIPAKEAMKWQKEAPLTKKSLWEGSEGRRWEEARWNRTTESALEGNRNEKFRPDEGADSPQILSYRELRRQDGPAWSEKSSTLGGGGNHSLRMYDGRLTRVREQVRMDETEPRDLGPGRQEKFSPDEVQKILSRPVSELLGNPKGQSGEASLHATADN